MSKATIILRTLQRVSSEGNQEVLEFQPGINVIAGVPNTGKTKWLRMLDYLMGERDSPENALGEDIAQKYDSLSGVFQIGEEILTFERKWKETGSKSKIFVDGQGLDASDWSQFLLQKLGIPILHFPQGNPYSERAWPEISWRMLMRHIYRQERFWSDIADKQPESEQYACLVQFLGLAESLFPVQYGELVDKQKRKLKLEARKEQFTETLAEISRDITNNPELSIAPTPESIKTAISKLEQKIAKLQADKKSILSQLIEHKDIAKAELGVHDATFLRQRWADLQSIHHERTRALENTKDRLSNLNTYYKTILEEKERLQRAMAAGEILADIKVTHCPVCDQPIEQTHSNFDNCFLCHRPKHSSPESNQRLEFEYNQVIEELKEISDLVDRLRQEEQTKLTEVRAVVEELTHIDRLLGPIRTAVAAILPPELSIIDQHVGRFEEQISQLKRIERTLRTRDELSAKIDQLTREVDSLTSEIDGLGGERNFSQLNDVLADGMNSYLNALNSGQPNRWPEGEVKVRLGERKFEFLIQNAKWATKLGATLRAYFLMAYHYSLLGLSGSSNYNYPGITIIDFPLTFADGTQVAGQENYIIEPFSNLINEFGSLPVQLIVAGRSFEKFENAHHIKLTHVWQ